MPPNTPPSAPDPRRTTLSPQLLDTLLRNLNAEDDPSQRRLPQSEELRRIASRLERMLGNGRAAASTAEQGHRPAHTPPGIELRLTQLVENMQQQMGQVLEGAQSQQQHLLDMFERLVLSQRPSLGPAANPAAAPALEPAAAPDAAPAATRETTTPTSAPRTDRTAPINDERTRSEDSAQLYREPDIQEIPRDKMGILQLLSRISARTNLRGFEQQLNNPSSFEEIWKNLRENFWQITDQQEGNISPLDQLSSDAEEAVQLHNGEGFEAILSHIQNPHDIQILYLVLQEVLNTGIMCHFNFEKLQPKPEAGSDSGLLEDCLEFKLHSQEQLRQMREESIIKTCFFLEITDLEHLPRIGDSSGLHHYLEIQGILIGNAIFGPFEADVATANVLVLERALDKGIIVCHQKGGPLDISAGKLLIFYLREPDHLHPEILRDYPWIDNGVRPRRLNREH